MMNKLNDRLSGKQPEPLVYKLVLTGGPCSGKTTGSVRLSTFFENMGWKVRELFCCLMNFVAFYFGIAFLSHSFLACITTNACSVGIFFISAFFIPVSFTVKMKNKQFSFIHRFIESRRQQQLYSVEESVSQT